MYVVNKCKLLPGSAMPHLYIASATWNSQYQTGGVPVVHRLQVICTRRVRHLFLVELFLSMEIVALMEANLSEAEEEAQLL